LNFVQASTAYLSFPLDSTANQHIDKFTNSRSNQNLPRHVMYYFWVIASCPINKRGWPHFTFHIHGLQIVVCAMCKKFIDYSESDFIVIPLSYPFHFTFNLSLGHTALRTWHIGIALLNQQQFYIRQYYCC